MTDPLVAFLRTLTGIGIYSVEILDELRKFGFEVSRYSNNVYSIERGVIETGVVTKTAEEIERELEHSTKGGYLKRGYHKDTLVDGVELGRAVHRVITGQEGPSVTMADAALGFREDIKSIERALSRDPLLN